MNEACSDPTCDDDAGLTLQRQMDVAPVPFCLEHGYRREAELKQRLENYRLVTVVQQAPSELELAKARLEELQARVSPDGDPAAGAELAEQLEAALQGLETQGKVLDDARAALEDRSEHLKVLRAEYDRQKAELERVRQELELAKREAQSAKDNLALCSAELERARVDIVALKGGTAALLASQEGAVITPPPPTRPDRPK